MYASTIAAHAHPLDPQPTGVEPKLGPITDIQAVLFDVYGTLLISGSGDVGVATESSKPQSLTESLRAAGVKFTGDAAQGLDDLHAAIADDHAVRKEQGIAFPEVRIAEIWATVLERWQSDGHIDADVEVTSRVTAQLAIEYEMRVNPVWPMPNLVDTLDALKAASITLGIVSNAQVFTPELFEPLTGRTLNSFGFVPELCFWSYEHRQAKPGTFLYEEAADVLTACGLSHERTLYVGNDMRNDIWPAHQVGFKTALFAGDKRSLRLREDHPEASAVTPDLVLTDLAQLPAAITAT